MPKLSKIKILVVEGDYFNRRLLKAYFSFEGADVQWATNLAEALVLVESMAFDAIILDMILPDGSGIEICESLRHDGFNKNVPIIFASSQDDQNIIDLGFAAGADAYMIKPYDLELLSRKILELIQARNAELAEDVWDLACLPVKT